MLKCIRYGFCPRSNPVARLNSPYMISYWYLIVTRGRSISNGMSIEEYKVLTKISRGICLHRVNVSATAMSINPRGGTYLEATYIHGQVFFESEYTFSHFLL